MNDQELALVLERDYKSLESKNVKVKKVIPNSIETRYLIDIVDTTNRDSIEFTFKVYNESDKLTLDWHFDLNKYNGDQQYLARNDDGFTYLSLTRSTTLMPLKTLLKWLTQEIISNYIQQLESDLKLIINALEGEQ